MVQVKVFLRPVTSAEEVLRKVQKFFPDQIAPPVVFVEWLAAVPVEIEMIAQLPDQGFMVPGQTGRGRRVLHPARGPAVGPAKASGTVVSQNNGS